MPSLALAKGPFDALARFCRDPLQSVQAWEGEDAVEKTYHLFRYFIAFKLFLNLFSFSFFSKFYDQASGAIVLSFGPILDDPHSPLLILALFLSLSRHFYWVGLLVIACMHAVFRFYASFPFTINHVAVEFIVLTIMILLASQQYGSQQAKRLNLLCVRLIQWLIVSIYVYSGLHKLTNGYYINGEMFSLIVFNDSQSMSTPILNVLLPYLMHFGVTIPWTPGCCTSAALVYPGWVVTWFLGLSWMVTLSEVFIPLFALYRRTRFYGALAFILMQMGIAVVSLELDFACSAVGMILLFFPHKAKVNYFLLLLFTIYIKLAQSGWIKYLMALLFGGSD